MMDMTWEMFLGEGSFGQVHKVKNRHTGAVSALKLIKTSDGKIGKAEKEMSNHQKAAASSEFVLKIIHWGQISDEFLYMQLELCSGGDVKRLLKGKKGMDDDTLRWKLYLQVLMGIVAIHSAGLIHLDIKPENVLLTDRNDARVADLGLATFAKDGDRTAIQTHAGGTKGYEAPEIASGKGFSVKADIYSLAVTFFEMRVGSVPDMSMSNPFAPLEKLGDPATLELILFMLKRVSSERPTSAECESRVKVLRSRQGQVP